MEIFFFGDQTADQHSILQKIVRQTSNQFVATFLDDCSAALQDEIRKPAYSRRQLVPRFQTLQDLVQGYYEHHVRLPELESSLLTIAQLAHYIGCQGESLQSLFNTNKTQVLGLCTGLLSAAAVASAQSITELIALGVLATRISFRLGRQAGDASDLLEPRYNGNESWSTVVTGLTENPLSEILENFHRSSGIAKPSCAYISATGSDTVTISGPPSVTKQLFLNAHLIGRPLVPLSIYAPYHAVHIFNLNDIDQIVDRDMHLLLKAYRPAKAICSTSSGTCLDADDSLSLYKQIITEILCRPARWDSMLVEILGSFPVKNPQSCKISCFGKVRNPDSIVSAFRGHGVDSLVMNENEDWASSLGIATRNPKHERIAIIGMAGRFPNAKDHEALWDILIRGLDVHREVPSDRFDAKAHCDPSGKGKNKSHTPYGCFIDQPGLFDSRFFNMSPREASQTDPMGRLALVTAYEALEMSGYKPNRTPSTMLHRIGTFYGQTSDDWREVNAAEEIDTYFITGCVRAFAPGRINYHFKFTGPSFSIDTACSSSLAAIQIACASLWAGDCDMACAGGVNILTNPDIFAGLSKGQFLSKTGSCKTYDNEADGYCRGDACCSIVLKRYNDAIADNDNILGCILAAGTNHSAEAMSITRPHAQAQEALYKKVLADAQVDPLEVSYVEMHGTGTQAGDGVEMTSVTNVFAPRSRPRQYDQPLHLGSIKANIGHGEAASGISSLVKVLLMMRENNIPPNIGVKGVINKSFPKDMMDRRINIPLSNVKFARSSDIPRKIFLNNFSAAGGNTAVLLEDGPATTSSKTLDSRTSHIIIVTAKAISSLKQNTKNLISYLDQNTGASIADLSYTTTARRMHHNYRLAIHASDITSAQSALKARVDEMPNAVQKIPATTVFAFTGQGSQYTGLAQKLYADLRFFRDHIDQMDRLAQLQGFPSILPLVKGINLHQLSPVQLQLGLVCVQVAVSRLWQSWGIHPMAVVGHSLGEYPALQTAGVISTSDMIFLVGRRAQLLESHCTPNSHGMLAVRGNVKDISSAIGPLVTEVACRNSPSETVLSGMMQSITAAQKTLTTEGFKATILKVPFAFHSSQIDPIKSQFREIANKVRYGEPKVPVLSAVTGEVICGPGMIDADYLVKHARDTVDFWSAVEAGRDRKVFTERSLWLEIGSHPICSAMITAILGVRTVTAASLRRGEDPWRTTCESICALFCAGADFDFEEYHHEFSPAHKLLNLPTYCFDNKNYWLSYNNNWCLSKGEATAAPASNEGLASLSGLHTTSCQRIVKEEIDGKLATVIVQSDITEPKLFAAITGHLVNEVPLCPSSIYADMALTVSDYAYKRLRPGSVGVGLDIGHMEVIKPLIAISPAPEDGQHLQIEARADLDVGKATIHYRSTSSDGKRLHDHAYCEVRFEDVETWQINWRKIDFMVQTQIDLLEKKSADGKAHKVLKGMAYKLFKACVDYSNPSFRGMEQVTFDAEETEAVALVRFATKDTDGEFTLSPYWIDSLAHVSGFVCNATDVLDSEQFAFISHGWASMKFVFPMSADKLYRSYVRMVPQSNSVMVGDVYIMDGKDIVGVVGGLKFQKIPRKTLRMLVAPATEKSSKQMQQPPVETLRELCPQASTVSLPLESNHKQKTDTDPSSSSLDTRALKIVASETNLDIAELVDDVAFDNLGVDSLLSLTIIARFREEFDMEVSSRIFSELQTIGGMRRYFSSFSNGSDTADDSQSTFSVEPADRPTSDEDVSTSSPLTTPPSTSGSENEGFFECVKSAKQSKRLFSMVRKVIIEEMSVRDSEIDRRASLQCLGLDSKMGLTILSKLRELTGLDLPSDFFVCHDTIGDNEASLGRKSRQGSAPAVAEAPLEPPTKDIKNMIAGEQMDTQDFRPVALQEIASKCPSATSVLLQGSSKRSARNIFLLPDGSGSATSYVSIGKISLDTTVYALNCPFMKNPQNFTIGVDGVSRLYINEIKRRQPRGPYLIGGWSAGGVIAFEVARQLVANKEEIAGLILIDSPCPVGLEPLPARLHQFFDHIGLLGPKGAGSSPDWLLPHFAASIKALGEYVPRALPVGKTPPTLLIWARQGVCGKPGDPRPPPAEDADPAPMRWLLDDRTDFGDNGWAHLLNTENMIFDVMEGNHFSIMTEEQGEVLAEKIRNALGLNGDSQYTWGR